MNDLKNIGIRQFLARRGIQPKYECNGYGMYLSPLREERTPSFKVDYVRNLWYDFGLGEGGTLRTLVMRLERCDSREAVRRLQNGEKRDAGSVSLSPGVGERPAAGGPLPVLRPAAVPALRILSDASLRHPALVGYLASRGIVPSVAAAFCREVRYEVNGCAFFAVGFRNDAGGWELRSARFKGGSSPKHITTIDNQFRHGDRLRGIYGFSRLSFAEIFRTTAHRRHSSELGRQPAQSRSVYLPASGDSRLLRQRRGRTQGNCRSDPSLPPQRGHRPKPFLQRTQGHKRLSDRPHKRPNTKAYDTEELPPISKGCSGSSE